MVPVRLEFVSPSSAEVLRSCLLRMWISKQSPGSGTSNPYARLGTMVHEIMEAAAKGALSGENAESEFERLWQAALVKQEALVSSNERHFGPLSRWRTYELTKARAKIAALELGASSLDREQFVETEFVARKGRLRGRPDRVVWENQELVIEDYKTGSIYEVDRELSAELKPSYRRQMLLYAVIVHETLNEWPGHARVIPLSGAVEELSVDAGEALTLAEEVLTLLETYNELVSRGSDVPASPGERVCGVCPYQLNCEEHWATAHDTWTSYLSTEGMVVGITQAMNGLLSVKLKTSRGNAPGPTVIVSRLDPLRFPGLDALSIGSVVRITKLRSQGKSCTPGFFTEFGVVTGA